MQPGIRRYPPGCERKCHKSFISPCENVHQDPVFVSENAGWPTATCYSRWVGPTHKAVRSTVHRLQYTVYKVKVKVTLVQALRLCTGRTTHRGSRGIALLCLDHGTRRGWGVSVTPRPLFTPGKDPVPIVQEAGWAPGPVWTGAENLAATGIRSPDRPARSRSLYQLCYPVHYNERYLVDMTLVMYPCVYPCP